MSDIGPIDGRSHPLVFDLRFEYRVPPLSLNQRLHHFEKARITREVREATVLLARRIPALGSCEVTLTWFVIDRRKRDAENPVPTLKAMCDGLVDQGVVVDDTPQYMVKHMPIIQWIDKATDSAHMVLRVASMPSKEVAA